MRAIPVILLALILVAAPLAAKEAPPQAPQWRSDKQDPAAIFTYLGYRMGQSLDEVKAMHGPFPYGKRIGPDAVLFADANGFGYPLVTELYFVGEKLTALKATFDNQMTPPDEVEIALRADYGPPDGNDVVDWVDKFGHHVRSVRMVWHTPVGTMQFDNKFDRLSQGAVQVNPEAIETLTKGNGL